MSICPFPAELVGGCRASQGCGPPKSSEESETRTATEDVAMSVSGARDSMREVEG